MQCEKILEGELVKVMYQLQPHDEDLLTHRVNGKLTCISAHIFCEQVRPVVLQSCSRVVL